MQTGNNPLAQAAALMQRGDAAGAYKLCQQLADRMPQEANLWYLMGMAAFRLGQGEEALQHLDRALEIRPQGPVMRMNRGLVRCQLGMAPEGLADLREAVRLRPDQLEAHQHLTSMLAGLGRHAEAIEACREALARFPNALDIRARLASVLEQKSLLEEARAEAEAVLQAQPGNDGAEFTLARIEARGGELAAARQRLETLLKRALPPARRSGVAGELAGILDRLGEPEAAFRAAERANEAALEMVPPALRGSTALPDRIRRCRAFFAPERVAGWGRAPDDGRDAPLFLVGFPRSGTTLTEQILSASGQVQASDEQPMVSLLLKELFQAHGEANYPALLSGLEAGEIARLRARYWALAEKMCGPLDPGRRFLDKLPLNIVELGLIHRLFPEARVLVLLRDPRDVCLSCFMNQFVPNEAMIHFTDLARTGSLYAAVMGLWLYYREVLPLDFHELRYEDLVEDFETRARGALEFFGLQWTDEVLDFHRHVGKRDVRTPSYRAIASGINRNAVARWTRYRAQLEPILPELAPFVEAFGYEPDGA